MPRFTHYRFFKFVRVKGSARAPSEHYSTSCFVKVADCEDFKEEIREGKGFLNFAPDLRATPSLAVVSPKNGTEVDKRLASVQGLMRRRRDVKDLQNLRRKVYRSRVQKFDWKLEQIPEMNGAYAPGEAKLASKGDEEGSDAGDEAEHADNGEYMDDALMDYAYTAGEFVAVIDEEGDHLGFWITRVKEVREGADGVAEELEVTWFESQKTRGRSNPLDTRYEVATKKGKVWDGIVSVNSVCATCDSHTPTGFLYASTKKAIHSSMAAYARS